ncbi:hypothetical protein K3495_g11613 [Podosphaera aphanis]|nr:hypothetical protein K3495_g11613 [Podosphaera aphanis]
MYIPQYAVKAAPLHERKVALYKYATNLAVKGNRSEQAVKWSLENISLEELASFESIQRAFRQTSMLVHLDPKKRLYTDLDSSAKGIGAMVYHSLEDPPMLKSSKPIMFLSRLWKSTEARYWPTEKEIAGLCLIVQKIRHFIEASEFSTVIYTDHSAALQIATHSSMTTRSPLRMNTRYVQSSEFLNRFRLEIRHKPGIQTSFQMLFLD